VLTFEAHWNSIQIGTGESESVIDTYTKSRGKVQLPSTEGVDGPALFSLENKWLKQEVK
ncbi:hypothetical protein HGM15179_000684, partial [Zosterops borbonicus]